MSRGRTGCVSFRLRRSCVQTTASPRAGACRLRRSGDGGCGKTNAASLKGIPKGLVPWAGSARRSPRGMVAWTRRPRGAQDGMLPSPGAPAKPFLKGRPFIHPTFPRDKPKSGAPTLKRFCPQGKQRRIRTPAAPLAPPGQGSVAKSRHSTYLCYDLADKAHCLPQAPNHNSRHNSRVLHLTASP